MPRPRRSYDSKNQLIKNIWSITIPNLMVSDNNGNKRRFFAIKWFEQPISTAEMQKYTKALLKKEGLSKYSKSIIIE